MSCLKLDILEREYAPMKVVFGKSLVRQKNAQKFNSVDPLADYYGQDRYSPYAAMGNQPESMIDPNGLKYESTYQGVHHYSTYFVDNGGYYKKSYGEKTMMDMRIEGIEGHIFNFIGSLGGASFSSEMQTQINNNAFWNYMMYIYLKSEGNFSLKAENNMLRLSFQTSWSENRVVVIQLNTFYIDLSSFGKSDYNNNIQENEGDGNRGLNLGDWGNINSGLGYVTGAVANRADKILVRNYNGYNPKSVIRTGRYIPYNIRVPTSTLKTTSTLLKGTGVVAGGVGIGITTYQYLNGQISGTEALFDAAFGIIGFMGPIGAGISIIYFGGKALYEYSTGESVFEKPGGQ